MLTKEKKEALTLMITLKNRKIESLISDNKGRIRCHLDQLLREPKTNDHGEPCPISVHTMAPVWKKKKYKVTKEKFNKLKNYTSNKFRIFLSF